ncbi:MAG: hypothetical protein H6535_05585 [Bacteroidia bacterium]|nr:hypothetical protein [Bacteroidia bacterium]
MRTQHNDAMSMSIPAYQQKYNEIAQSNIGKIADARAAMENDDHTAAALLKLYSLVNQNQQEENMKQTLAKNMEGFATNPLPDPADITTLNDIAHQHPFYGGIAVYYARAMLRLNIEDVLPQLRKAHQQNSNVKNNIAPSLLSVSPNPATNTATFKCNISFAKGSTLIIENALGHIIKSYYLPENTSSF